MSKGRALILIGHAGHPEVEGTMGQVPGPVLLVQNVNDAAALTLPKDTPVAYITQTTLSVDDTKDIIAALQDRFADIQGPDIRDICYATQNRQSAVRDLSKLVDVILVVGAANSSNSNRLSEIGTEAGVPSYLIADGNELNPDWLRDARAVGITAGASAPRCWLKMSLRPCGGSDRSKYRYCRVGRKTSNSGCPRSSRPADN
jgi:4-hydroxy-3-methylbut-2-enyl diphosphate reductase